MTMQMEARDKEERVVFDVTQIMKILPHRYPFLMVDKVIELEDNQRILAVKNVTINESFFTGHFPERPVMPGVMLLEAMAQVAAILAHVSEDGVAQGKTVFLVRANDFKWKRMVLPGDVLMIEMRSVRKRRPMWVMEGDIKVDGEIVASGTLSAAEAE